MKPRIIVITVAGLLALNSAQASENSAKRSTKIPATPAIQPVPAPPPTLEQMPAVPPQVSYTDGKLTVKAQNSTLGDILKAIHVQTGAQIDVPGNAAERVVGQFGPGPARDVLSELLNGSHFNYVLLGSEANPLGLDHVILLAKSGGSAGSSAPVQEASGEENPATPNPALAANGMVRPLPGRFAPPNANQQVVEGEDATDDSADAADDSADDSADATDDQNADDQQQGDEAAATDGDQQQNGQPGVKTPEQLLQELQQQQQQGGVQQGVPPQGVPPGMPPGLQPHN